MNTLLLIHGFAGTARTWSEMLSHFDSQIHPIAINLPGHGGEPVPLRPIVLDDLAKRVLAKSSGTTDVCGYSMGGRIALHAALNLPERVNKLILIGASPGIENQRERAERLEKDHVLAKNIRKRGIEWFTEYWESLPIFDSQKTLLQDVRDRIRNERLACDPEGLAYALEVWSTGIQRYLIPELDKLRCPVLLIAGALDQKFCELNRMMQAAIGANAKRVEIANAGHAAHLENPKAVADEINKFIF